MFNFEAENFDIEALRGEINRLRGANPEGLFEYLGDDVDVDGMSYEVVTALGTGHTHFVSYISFSGAFGTSGEGGQGSSRAFRKSGRRDQQLALRSSRWISPRSENITHPVSSGLLHMW